VRAVSHAAAGKANGQSVHQKREADAEQGWIGEGGVTRDRLILFGRQDAQLPIDGGTGGGRFVRLDSGCGQKREISR
jgi:hypothetical protein